MRSAFARLCRILTGVLACLAVSLAFNIRAYANDSIVYSEKYKLWVLQAGETTYAFGVNESGELQNIYWGGHVDSEEFSTPHSLQGWASFDLSTTTTPQEYPGWGAGLYTEPALKATFPNGNREVVLHYVSQQLKSDHLEITLKDEASSLFVHLRYRVYPDNGVVERSARIENGTSETVTLESAQSAAWTVPPDRSYELHYLTGRWAGEWQLQREPLQIGKRVIESRRGSTGNEANPWFAIDRLGETNEDRGPVWFGELGWSGSWRFTIERTSSDQCRVVGGFNPFDFSYPLAPGESLQTPSFYAGFTNGGLGTASRLLHRFQREQILPGAPHPRLRSVLYNSWEATEFNVNEAGQIALAQKAGSSE